MNLFNNKPLFTASKLTNKNKTTSNDNAKIVTENFKQKFLMICILQVTFDKLKNKKLIKKSIITSFRMSACHYLPIKLLSKKFR